MKTIINIVENNMETITMTLPQDYMLPYYNKGSINNWDCDSQETQAIIFLIRTGVIMTIDFLGSYNKELNECMVTLKRNGCYPYSFNFKYLKNEGIKIFDILTSLQCFDMISFDAFRMASVYGGTTEDFEKYKYLKNEYEKLCGIFSEIELDKIKNRFI